MANRNSGAWVRGENGMQLLLGTDVILNLVPGTWKCRPMQRQRVGNRDRGVLGAMTVGDERPTEWEFQLWRTNSLDALKALLIPAATNGVETFFTLTVKIPDYDGAATGSSQVFNKSMLPDGFDDQAGGAGEDADKITIKGMHYGPYPTPTTY